MTQASPSYVATFEAAIALLWADGELSPEEKARFESLIQSNIRLGEDQKSTLISELTSPKKVEDVWPAITDKHDRAHLINIATMLFWEDGAYCHTEQEIYQKLKKDHLSGLDTASLEEEIQEMAEAAKSKLAKEEQNRIDAMKPHTRFFHYLEEKLTGR
jgi:hypothetical protein